MTCFELKGYLSCGWNFIYKYCIFYNYQDDFHCIPNAQMVGDSHSLVHDSVR